MDFKEKRVKIALIIIAIIVIAGALIFFKQYKNSDGFEMNTLLFKISVKQGEAVQRTLEITNLKENNNFELMTKNLDDKVYLSETSFKINKGWSKKIDISFGGNSTLAPGVYVGKIIVSSNFGEKIIPVIIEVATKTSSFASSVDLAKEEISRGEKITAGIKLLNLDDAKSHALEVVYAVKNMDSNDIFSENEKIAVSSEAVYTKTLAVPEDVKLGEYVFYIIVKENNLTATSSKLFTISGSASKFFSGNFFVPLTFLFLFGVLILVFYLFRERDKLFLELQRQHNQELNMIREELKKQKESCILGTRDENKRQQIEREFAIAEETAIKKVKIKHEEQKKIFKKLRKEHKVDELAKKMREWKKQGFDVDVLKEASSPKKSMKDKIREWKKQGFDVGVIGK